MLVIIVGRKIKSAMDADVVGSAVNATKTIVSASITPKNVSLLVLVFLFILSSCSRSAKQIQDKFEGIISQFLKFANINYSLLSSSIGFVVTWLLSKSNSLIALSKSSSEDISISRYGFE